MENIQAEIEALIFSAEEPVSIGELSRLLEVSKAIIRSNIKDIADSYQTDNHGIYLKEYSSGYMFVTKADYASIIREMHNKRVTRLSQAALETLAIIAYKQPITRGEIEEIRGVKAEKTLLTLSKYSLIEEIGRKDTLGNPIVYGTTDRFLQLFDLQDLSRLPEISMDELEIPVE
ncbi:MAG: SMC-Scp complex subunit ScpB [Halanaerobiales bacterium]